MSKALIQSHKAALECQKSLLWFAGVVEFWRNKTDADFDDAERDSAAVLEGLKKQVGILGNNYISGHAAIKKVQDRWIGASPNIVEYCGVSGCSAHNLTLILAEKTLKLFEFWFCRNYGSRLNDWRSIDFDEIGSDLGDFFDELNFLGLKELNALGEHLKREKALVNPMAHKSDNGDKIPPEKRTKPMSYSAAAKYMGKGKSKNAAEWVKKCVDDKTISCEQKTRQTHIFSIDDFPATVLSMITPSPKVPPTHPKSP